MSRDPSNPWRAWLAGVFVLLLLGGAGWFIYSWLGHGIKPGPVTITPPPAHEPEIRLVPPTPLLATHQPATDRVDAHVITKLLIEYFNAGPLSMSVSAYRGGAVPPSCGYTFRNPPRLDQDEMLLILMARRLCEFDPGGKQSSKLGIDAQQVAQLKELPPQAPYGPDARQQQTLLKLYAAIDAAPDAASKAAARDALLAEVDKIGQAAADKSTTTQSASVQIVHRVLTTQQATRLLDSLPGRPAAATAPATQPMLAQQADGYHTIQTTTVSGGWVNLYAVRLDQQPPTIHFNCSDPAGMPLADSMLMYRVTQDQTSLALKLSDEQRQQLRQLVATPVDFQACIANRPTIEALYESWDKAPDGSPQKATAEKALLDAVQAARSASIERYQLGWKEAVAKVQAILTAEQWQQLKQPPGIQR